MTPESQQEFTKGAEDLQHDCAIKEAFERVRLAREDLMKRRGRKYKQSVPERNWKSPVKDD